MSILNRLATLQGQQDDVPNQELARELAAQRNAEGIREIAEALWNPDPAIQSDCIKVLYEIGYLAPDLIAAYADDFLRLLPSRNNRLVWGGMIALSTIAYLKADALFARREVIQQAMEKGSVITLDRGVKALSDIAAQREEYRSALFPYLLEHLKHCPAKDVSQRAEKIAVAATAQNRQAFIAVLEGRLPEMTPSQASRLQRVIKAMANLGTPSASSASLE